VEIVIVALGFRAFDLLVNGKYLDVDAYFGLCAQYGVETVPVLYRGPFVLDTVREHAAGDTTFAANHIREGVVVKPAVERTNPKVGRVALKYIGDQYLFSKSADRDTRDV
jgi:ATP-dependent RNA circularization protein (DNA/RNA ligase family)